MAGNKHPLISVLTPTWNRADYLEKVWYGLVSQEYQNIEWIVGNDGSDDQTVEVLKRLAAKSKFPITLIDSNIRIGKSRIDNLLMDIARGELLIWNDSDDYLLPGALSLMLKAWLQIPVIKRPNYLGIMAQCISTDNVIQGKNFDKQFNEIDTTYEEFSLKTSGDATLLIPKKSVKNKRFIEVDFLINESSLWAKVFRDKRLVYLPVVVKVMDRKAPESISFGKKLQYTRGMAYSIAKSEAGAKFVRRSVYTKCSLIVRYWRYCWHGELDFVKAKKMWRVTRKNSWPLMLYPIALLFVIMDLARCKVEKTHQCFDKAKTTAKVQICILN